MLHRIHSGDVAYSEERKGIDIELLFGSFCVTWFVYEFYMNHLYVHHEPFVCVSWIIHLYVRHESSTCMCVMNQSLVWHDVYGQRMYKRPPDIFFENSPCDQKWISDGLAMD